MVKFILGRGTGKINKIVINKLFKLGFKKGDSIEDSNIIWEYFHFLRPHEVANFTKTRRLIGSRILNLGSFREDQHLYNAIFPYYADKETDQQGLRNPLGLKHKLYYILFKYYENNGLDLNDLHSFVPVTFNLDYKEDRKRYNLFIEGDKSSRFLMKPSDLSEGKNITFITRDNIDSKLKNTPLRTTNAIKINRSTLFIQRYLDIENPPLLIKTKGTNIWRKFNLRVHILLASVDPLLCFKYCNHVMRCSFKRYNVTDIKACISNARVNNKDSDIKNKVGNMVFPFNANGLLKGDYVFDQHTDPDSFFGIIEPQIDKIIRIIMKASEGYFLNIFGTFHLFALDLQVDKNFNVHLLEVNEQPDLGYTNRLIPISILGGYLDIVKRLYIKGNKKVSKEEFGSDGINEFARRRSYELIDLNE